MAGPEITKLKRILREKALPPGVNITMEQRRQGMEKVAFKAANDITVENVTVAGRTAEWLRAPEVQE
ncbi:MAG: hypothetical protein ACREQ3_17580, partial [Candidatus Binatia bacterium]